MVRQLKSDVRFAALSVFNIIISGEWRVAALCCH